MDFLEGLAFECVCGLCKGTICWERECDVMDWEGEYVWINERCVCGEW
jgi:hypothetical protein